MGERTQSAYDRLNTAFQRDAVTHWGHLSRASNLLIALNISLFFLSGLVTKYGYYYTYYSLFALGLIQLALFLPFGLLHRLWYYVLQLVWLAVALYFFLASVVFWVKMGKEMAIG